jgi:hypothetical protein
MLSYFPQIYPGELLYSVLARYHRHMGAPSPIQSMEALFGRRLVVASIDLPGYLQVLADRLLPGFGWTADRIVNQLTLLPYYTAFQSAGAARRAQEAMKRGATDGLMVRLGLAAFRVGRVTQLRFCSICLQEMGQRHSEFYWRRDHQLPSVLVCPDHGCPLQVSGVSTTAQGRHVYLPADRKTCPWNAPELVDSGNGRVLTALLKLAKASASLLENPGSHKTLQQWTRHYRHGLQTVGLASSALRIDQQRLEAAFHAHHRDLLSLMPGLMKGKRIAGDWLAAMGRKHRKAFHPLHHVLLQDFLEHQETTFGPFGDGPWPCLNPLARHRRRSNIPTVQLHRNNGHLVGIFACQCGYSYTRSFFSGSGKVGPSRFKNYGPMLEPALREMVKTGQTLRATARRLELDPKTVVKLAGELEIVTRWKPRTQETCLQNVTPTTTQVRKEPSLPKRGTSPARPRIDWGDLDRKVCLQVGQVAQQLRELTPLVRVSLLQVERRLWNRGWLSKRADKLPKSMACLQEEIESVEQFQQRRARWVIREMNQSDEPLQVWRILRKAGLQFSHAKLIEALLAEHFDMERRQAA